MSFSNTMSSYVRYHTNRAAYAEIQRQKREKLASDRFFQKFHTWRRSYDLNGITEQNLQHHLVKELENVWLDNAELAKVYEAIESAGLTPILPREYKLNQDTELHDEIVREGLAEQNRGGYIIIGGYIILCTAFIVQIIAEMFGFGPLVGAFSMLIYIGVGAHYVWKLADIHRLRRNITDEQLKTARPLVSFEDVQVFRERAEASFTQKTIPSDASYHKYQTSRLGDQAVRML